MQEEKEKRLFTLDTETRGLFGGLVRVGFFDGENYRAFYNFSELSDVLDEYRDTENHVYVHNLDFDLAKIAPELFNKETVCFSNSIFINSSVASLDAGRIILHDSFKLLPSSLDKLCKDFGLTDNRKRDLTEYMIEQGYAVYKADGTMNKKESLGKFFENVDADDPVYNEYLEYDCRSLYEILKIVMEISELEVDELVRCPTTASLAMTVFKTNYPDDYKRATSTKYYGEYGELLETFARMSYYGGRTEMFRPHMEAGFHYDVNSLYPYVMKIGKFPVGTPKLYEGEDGKQKYTSWKRRAVGGGIAWVRVHVPEDMYIPPLPRHDKSGKLLFPVGKIEGCWTFPELMEAERVGCTIDEFIEVVYFEKCEYIFKDFVEHFETIKNTSHGAKRTFAKLCQNSLYGKFGMNRIRTSYADMNEKQRLIDEKIPFVVHHHNMNRIHLDFIEHESEAKAQYIQPHIACYVTAYARIVLLRGLLQQQKVGDVHYCDTDSIACTSELPPDMVHDIEYGKFKLESIIDEGIFLQPKFYAEREQGGHVTLRAKGIPREAMQELSFESYREWFDIIKEGSRAKIDVFTGLKARTKFISAMKSNEDLDKVREMKKSINLMLEQKRIVDYNANTTKPHQRYDYGEKAGLIQEYAKDEFKQRLENYVDDLDYLREAIEDHGYIKTPEKTSRYYESYERITQSNKRKCFRKNAESDIEEWCRLTGMPIEELLIELEG